MFLINGVLPVSSSLNQKLVGDWSKRCGSNETRQEYSRNEDHWRSYHIIQDLRLYNSRKKPTAYLKLPRVDVSQPNINDGVTQEEVTHVTSRSNLFPRIVMSANP